MIGERFISKCLEKIEIIGKSRSQTFLTVLLSFCFGIACYSFFASKIVSFNFLILFAIFLATALFFFRYPVGRLAVFGMLFFILAIFWFAVREQLLFNSSGIYGLADQSVSIRGVITSLPKYQTSGVTYQISLEQILERQNWKKISGKILLQTVRFPEYHYGDRLVFTCVPKIFDEEKGKLAASGASALCVSREAADRINENIGDPLMGFLLKLRSNFLNGISTILPEPQAGLLSGLLVGEQSGLDKKLIEYFRNTGTMHMIAISGFNVSIITFGLFNLARAMFGRKRAFWITLFLLLGFVFIVGAGASVVRAGIMGAIVLLGKYLGRRGDMFRLLMVAASLMLFANPWLLRYNLGFDLSFLATFGLLVLSKPVDMFFKWLPDDFEVRSTLVETISATLATMPMSIVSFGYVSIIAPLANVVVLLLVPTTMFVGFFAVLLSWLPFVNQIFSFLSWALLSAIIGFVEILGSLPYARISLTGFSAAISIIVSLALILVLYIFGKMKIKDESVSEKNLI